jgi:hypothetical protein
MHLVEHHNNSFSHKKNTYKLQCKMNQGEGIGNSFAILGPNNTHTTLNIVFSLSVGWRPLQDTP